MDLVGSGAPHPDVVSRDGFAAWVAPHWQSMSRLAFRLAGPSEWEDVLQESLSIAWRKRTRFDPERGTARNWLLALTADQSRKARRRRRVVAIPARYDTAESRSPDVDRDVDIGRSIGRLSSRQRLVVELYYFLDLSVPDVAAIMSCSPGTVKSTLSDARARLRRDLEVTGDD